MGALYSPAWSTVMLKLPLRMPATPTTKSEHSTAALAKDRKWYCLRCRHFLVLQDFRQMYPQDCKPQGQSTGRNPTQESEKDSWSGGGPLDEARAGVWATEDRVWRVTW